MADVMMMLGSYQFGLDTAAFQELNRDSAWNWPSQDVFESRPVLQFTGFGEESISLPGIIFPEYWGGTGQLDDLRALADLGQPQLLIDGRGNILGEWVITGVQERQSIFAQAGVGRRQEFTVTLKRFGDGTTASIAASSATNATATTSTATQQASDVATNAGGAAAKAIAGMNSAAASVQAIAAAVVTPVQKTLDAVGQAKNAAQTLQRAATDARSTIKALGNIKNLSQAQSALGGLMTTARTTGQIAATAGSVIRSTQTAMAAVGDATSAIRTVQGAEAEANKLVVSCTEIWTQANDVLKGFA